MKKLLIQITILTLFLTQGFAAERIKLTDGKFGKTFIYQNDPAHWITARALQAYQKFPITVECWVKTEPGQETNVLLSLGPREYTSHWEILETSHGLWGFGAYLPGYSPSSFFTGRAKTPPQWHYCVAILTGSKVKIYNDGIENLNVDMSALNDGKTIKVHLPDKLPDDAKLFFGTNMINILNVQQSKGLVDEIRISDIERKIEGIPQEPFKNDEHTIGLWHFDEMDPVNGFTDYSSKKNHAAIVEIPKTSLDEIDRKSYAPSSIPVQTPYKEVKIKPGAIELPGTATLFSLDGTWELAEEGTDVDRLHKPWIDAIPAEVPGSVHNALFHAGLLPDPTVGKNMMLARDKSYKDHWYRKQFLRPSGILSPVLKIDGVCETYSVWMNGQFVGDHKGKYIPRTFDVSKILKDTNTVIIKVNKINRNLTFYGGYWADGDTPEDINVQATMGWHYANMPLHGIWKSVSIEENPAVKVLNPFVATENATSGLIHLFLNIRLGEKGGKGKIVGQILPENFTGKPCYFTEEVELNSDDNHFHYRMKVPDPQLWWPVDMGKPNLYRLKIAFIQENGAADEKETIFGIRTIENRPLPGGPHAYQYNWQFVINGKPMFLKGANWSPIDAYLDLRKERYERFIQLAKDQHIQIFRAWGIGIAELEAFYDLCDRYGIMVYQEFEEGPYDIDVQSMTAFILQRRNHPSLAMYSGGNELKIPYGEHIQLMGRLALELDGTRTIHRTDPWGGSVHNYSVYWGNEPYEANLKLKTPFVGEFGFTSPPNIESVLKYLPEHEKTLWPAPDKGSFAFHAPAFNRNASYGRDMSHMTFYAKQMMPLNTMADFITGTQLAHATGLRIMSEQFRSLWPDRTGICYYKFNEFVPAASYSSVDYYGVPKMVHYFMMDAYEPLHACAIIDTLNCFGKGCSPKIYILDDNNALEKSTWEVRARAFDANLKQIAQKVFKRNKPINKTEYLGNFTLTSQQTQTTPLLIVTEVYKNGDLSDRTFYWMNFLAKPGCLMELPKTNLSLSFEGNVAVIQNTGDVPAVGVHFDCPEISDKFRAEHSYFWLDPKETRRVNVNLNEGIKIKAWNSN
ncbi:MAG: hypothetical protein M0Q53_18980 [Prolixibacteraceae bacterium]|jgi:beta-mannosidase|nr:hypothetical protein [Prolixibacteraceae bacterium]